MRGKVKMQDEKTMWYENDAPVQEYLDRTLSRRASVAEKDPKTVPSEISKISSEN
jgi:hypothetical protein